MASKYIETYFRIDCGYRWGVGLDAERTRAWHDETALLFLSKGWTVQPAGTPGIDNVFYVIKGKTKLYAHPMDLSGPCEESLIPVVEGILLEGRSWTYRKTDRFDELADMSDAELLAHYRSRKDEIDSLLLSYCTTRRRGLYKRASEAVLAVGNRIRTKTIDRHLGVRTSGDPEWEAVDERLRALVEEGLITVSARDRDLVRRAAPGKAADAVPEPGLFTA